MVECIESMVYVLDNKQDFLDDMKIIFIRAKIKQGTIMPGQGIAVCHGKTTVVKRIYDTDKSIVNEANPKQIMDLVLESTLIN